MKLFKSFYKLIFLAIILLFPTQKSLAISQEVPIKVDWYYNEDKWDKSPHRSDIVIEPLGSAPLPQGVGEFNGVGDLEFNFAPNFDKPGKYEYSIYQNNQDIEENHMWVRYDKAVYRLVFFVQANKGSLEISAYVYNNDDYDAKKLNPGKVASIEFKNSDPVFHSQDGSIVKPTDPDHPDYTKNPQYPEDPNKSLSVSKNLNLENKNSTDNVKTAVKGLCPYFGLLTIALVLLTLLNNKIKKYKNDALKHD